MDEWKSGLTFTADWFCRRSLAFWREYILPRAPFQSYLEVGVYEGMSLAYAFRNLIDDGGQAIGIDAWQPIRKQTKKWIDLASRVRSNAFANLDVLRSGPTSSCVNLIESDSFVGLSKLGYNGYRFDLIYVDGGHRADCALRDLCMCWAMLEDEGVLILDDLHLDAVRRRRHDPKVREAWHAFSSTHLGIEVLYDSGDQIGVKKYRARLPKHPSS